MPRKKVCRSSRNCSRKSCVVQRKTCRTTKRRTGFSRSVENAIDQSIREYRRMLAIQKVGSWIVNGVKWLFGKNNDIDPIKALEAANSIKLDLLKRGINKKESIFQKIKDFEKTIKLIQFLDSKKEETLKEYHTQDAKEQYEKIIKKYNKIITA